MTLASDVCRCLGRTLDHTVCCPRRETCARYRAWADDRSDAVAPVAALLCDDAFVAYIPVDAAP